MKNGKEYGVGNIGKAGGKFLSCRIINYDESYYSNDLKKTTVQEIDLRKKFMDKKKLVLRIAFYGSINVNSHAKKCYQRFPPNQHIFNLSYSEILLSSLHNNSRFNVQASKLFSKTPDISEESFVTLITVRITSSK